jgi:acyl-CoA thioester hydrolase
VTRSAVVEIPLRWSDQDAYGHLNNARAVTLLEEARIKFLWRDVVDRRPDRPYDGPDFRGGLIVVGLNVDYRRQVRFRTDVLLRVAMHIDEVRAASFRINYDVHDGSGDDAPLAIRAWTRMALFDMEAQRPRRLGEAEKAYLRGPVEVSS